ncbi:MAG: TIGR03435 family protein, partial [Candidatus Acidiferrales bacterium]
GLLSAPLLHAQSTADWEKAAGGKMSFEVASVKRNPETMNRDAVHSNVDLDSGDRFLPTGGLFSATDFPLIAYTGFAFKLPIDQLLSLQSQMPKWAADRYDIEGRAAGNPTKDQYRLMMQTLLSERFKLAYHVVTKQSPVLSIVADNPRKLGPQLQRHTGKVPCPSGTPVAGSPLTVAGGFPLACGSLVGFPPTVRGRVHIGARDVPITVLTDLVVGKGLMSFDKPIVDQTSLGRIDFVIEFTPDVAPDNGGRIDSDGPTFLDALKDQLGVKLTSATGEVSTLVIDHIEEPTPN